MQTLWTPWRAKYINGEEKPPSCVFCRVQTETDGPQNLVAWRGTHNFIILNLYPYTNGHAMVVPLEHVGSLEGMSAPARAEMMEVMVGLMQALRELYHPPAFNLGANIGFEAGAGIAEHVHMHVLPRWNGDTNFMTTVGETRVVPEALELTYEKLRKALKGLLPQA